MDSPIIVKLHVLHECDGYWPIGTERILSKIPAKSVSHRLSFVSHLPPPIIMFVVDPVGDYYGHDRPSFDSRV